jgi:hypothetical protein
MFMLTSTERQGEGSKHFVAFGFGRGGSPEPPRPLGSIAPTYNPGD